MPRTIRVAHSPDSDDAFMFYALAERLIDTGDLAFEHVLKDIESLNRDAREGRYEVTAISIHAYAHLADRYALLPHGASMGDGYGPVLVAHRPTTKEQLVGSHAVAIPGEWTTAALALRLWAPEVETTVMAFDEILPAVLEGRVAAGVIIHEGQLTYEEEGAHAVVDLGVWWKGETDLPLPLGGNAIRRDLGGLIPEVSRLLRASIAYSLEHRAAALAHSMKYARGLTEERADRFVGMYVNDLTLDYGDRGERAVRLLLSRAREAGLIPEVDVAFVG